MIPAPWLVIDLDKIRHNVRTLLERLSKRGISVTGVTKGTLGSAESSTALLEAGVKRLGDSRIENIEAMHLAQVPASVMVWPASLLSSASDLGASRGTGS